jgi:hypothetical protein
LLLEKISTGTERTGSNRTTTNLKPVNLAGQTKCIALVSSDVQGRGEEGGHEPPLIRSDSLLMTESKVEVVLCILVLGIQLIVQQVVAHHYKI